MVTTGVKVSLSAISMGKSYIRQQPTFAINQFFRKANFPSPLGNGPITEKWEELSRFCHGGWHLYDVDMTSAS